MNAILRIDAAWRRLYVAAALILTAWLALAVWSISPYDRWLDHAQIEDIAAPLAVRLAVFTLGWILMIIAMMLPSTLLLIRCTENKRIVAPMILAYLAVWAGFGSVSYWGDTLLHEFVEHVPALASFIVPGVLLLAGSYQLTPMKRICLARCSPKGTVFKAVGHHQNTWMVGLRHGLFCLGSGWALMLLMLAIGGVNLLWMLILGTIMIVERQSRLGEGVAQLLGTVLITVSLLLIIA